MIVTVDSLTHSSRLHVDGALWQNDSNSTTHEKEEGLK